MKIVDVISIKYYYLVKAPLLDIVIRVKIARIIEKKVKNRIFIIRNVVIQMEFPILRNIVE